MAYIGVSPSNGVRQKHTYTATASQTTFSGAGAEGVSLSYRDSNYVDVYRNGVKLGDADYTATSGTAIVLGEGAAVSDIIEIVTYDVFSVADTVSKADGGVFDGNVTMAGTLAVTGETTLSANLNLGDNDKAIFGTGDDLQIFHNETHSYVQDSGTGNLYIAGSNVIISNPTGTETMAYFDDDGAVSLWYNNNVKLATTFTGIDVTGTAVTDGLTVAGNVSIDGGTIKLDGNYPTGTDNVALGNTALGSIQSGGNYNVVVGSSAGNAITSGDQNTAIGDVTLRNTTTASNNVAVGAVAMNVNTTGGNNVAVGTNALRSNTTASNNTAVGYQAGYSNTTGVVNAAFGRETLASNTSGSFNTAFGTNALFSNTTASNNTAVGYQAGYSNTTGTNNTIIGYQAGYYNVNSDSTLIGQSAGFNLSYSGTGRNTFIGFLSGSSVTSGRYNTILGSYNGNQGGLDIRTSSNNIVLSDGDGNPRVHVNSSGHMSLRQGASSGDSVGSKTCTFSIDQNINSGYALGIDNLRNSNDSGGILLRNYEVAGTYYAVMFFNSGNSSVGNITTSNTSTTYNTSSDYRLKENVVELTGATDRLKQLNPSRFNFIADADTTVDGFLAHEVQTVVPEAITGTHNEVDADGNPVYQGIDQSKLVPLLVKTIQELEARIVALEQAK